MIGWLLRKRRKAQHAAKENCTKKTEQVTSNASDCTRIQACKAKYGKVFNKNKHSVPPVAQVVSIRSFLYTFMMSSTAPL